MVLSVKVKGTVDNGVKTPNAGYNVLIKKPTNIKKAILNPIESKNLSIELSSFNLKIVKSKKPGIKRK